MNINPISPNICIQILQTDLYTVCYCISWEKNIRALLFALVIVLSILITFSLGLVSVIMLEENWCLSLFAFKGSNERIH